MFSNNKKQKLKQENKNVPHGLCATDPSTRMAIGAIRLKPALLRLGSQYILCQPGYNKMYNRDADAGAVCE